MNVHSNLPCAALATALLASAPLVSLAGDALPLRQLMDTPLRDPSICRGPEGTWYLTGTVEPFWGYNQGIKLWKSPDLVHWEGLGFVWKYGASPWHRKYLEAKKPLWAPEIHYLKGTFWLTYSMPGWDGTAKTSGSGLLRSTTGRPEGPYADVQPTERLGDEIDASLFEDDDGAVYFLWHSGKIARMKSDMSGLAEPYHWLRTTVADPNPRRHSGLCAGIFGKDSFDHIGYEGMFMFKRGGRYYLASAENFEGRYSCAIAVATNLFGPYGERYEALPHAGHNTFFQDAQGQWWSTFFGSDATAPWRERPGVFPIEFDADGRVKPGKLPGKSAAAEALAGSSPLSVIVIDPPERGFFAKRLDYEGIPIKAPTNVVDAALFAARERLSMLLSNLPSVRVNLRAAGAELHIIGRDQVTTDLPEWRHDKGKPLADYHGLTRDQRTRGMGGLLTSCGEENLLKLEKDRYRGRDICVHEFAHNILHHGASAAVRQKVREQYRRSLDRGLWVGSYAGSNYDEFFAELTMWYFGTHGDLGMKAPKPANGRAGLQAYDPEAFALLDEFYRGRLEPAGTRVSPQ